MISWRLLGPCKVSRTDLACLRPPKLGRLAVNSGTQQYRTCTANACRVAGPCVTHALPLTRIGFRVLTSLNPHLRRRLVLSGSGVRGWGGSVPEVRWAVRRYFVKRTDEASRRRKTMHRAAWANPWEFSGLGFLFCFWAAFRTLETSELLSIVSGYPTNT